MIMKKYFFNSFMFAVACVLAFTACSSSSDDDDSPAGSPQANFENNFFAIPSAIYQAGAMPNSTSNDVISGIEINDQALTSGSNFITVTSADAYDRFYIGVDGESGYYEVVPTDMMANSTRAGGLYSYIIYLNYGANYNRNITMVVKGRKTSGAVTQAYRKAIRYVQTRISGDLTVNLTFNNEKDVDLRLTTPSGEEIYYGNKTLSVRDEVGDSIVRFGLDHDSNANCNIDGLKNENIVIPEIAVEPGEYTVRVDMYKNCDKLVSTSWQLVVRYKGQLVQNLLPQRTPGENAMASSPTNLATTIESSITDAKHNPVWGTYPVNAYSRDKTIVMKFKVKDASTTRGFTPVIIQDYQPTLMDYSKMKDEEEGLNK